MKRGLKDEKLDRHIAEERVATYAPMKRGLKASGHDIRPRHLLRSNLCPDEKGTESSGDKTFTDRLWNVATYAPMKRGLKE